MEKKLVPELGEGWHWVCPTPGCGAAGFGFDILPTDPEWKDEHGNGWHCVEEEDYYGTVDGSVWDQFCADSLDASLPAADAPDELHITYDTDPDPALRRMLSPEEWEKMRKEIICDDIPF